MAYINHNLQRRLLQLVAKDQQVRQKLIQQGKLFAGYAPEMEQIHLENAHELQGVIEQHGWPDHSLVGAEGAEAAWLIVQHAISFPNSNKIAYSLSKRRSRRMKLSPNIWLI